MRKRTDMKKVYVRLTVNLADTAPDYMPTKETLVFLPGTK